METEMSSQSHASIFDLLFTIRILHVTVGTVDGDAAVASPQVGADVVAVAANSGRLRALIDVCESEDYKSSGSLRIRPTFARP